ncbi:hypothetical protein LCGC14_0364550 [marine sediment metagenome]|uniref:Uncharacterized protein n=1 Tax=marine sediment metagenome TaxID=412755 RepID=A0A0F9WFA8_9ZZZZ
MKTKDKIFEIIIILLLGFSLLANILQWEENRELEELKDAYREEAAGDKN